MSADFHLDPAREALATAAAELHELRTENMRLRHQARDQWLKVYASLRAEQKVIVRDELKARMARMDAMQERMKERKPARHS